MRGLSVGSVPAAKDLYECDALRAEKTLGIEGIIKRDDYKHIPPQERLYAWADDVISELNKRGVDIPKLKLAEALGLISDPRWWGGAEVDFRGNTPRHRVVARFAKEGLWHSIWSFNWDCILEKAFEQIGLSKGLPFFKSPWAKNHYVAHIDSDDFRASIDPSALNIHKPHGCVRALQKAYDLETSDPGRSDKLSYRLMIGKQELRNRKGIKAAEREDNAFFDAMGDDVRNRLNVVLGWSMGEQSLKDNLSKYLNPLGNTRLAILDLDFCQNHQEICNVAGLQKNDVYCELESKGSPDRDDIFLFQQTLFVIEILEAEGGAPVIDDSGVNWKTSFSPGADSFLEGWADEFLPAWTRLCWSSGVVTANLFQSHQVDLERRDEYVPLNYRHVERQDLISAIKILNSIPKLGAGFDTKSFPGGFFHEDTRTLIIPIPCWNGLNELRALRPLVDSLRGNLGFVNRLVGWPIRIGECCGKNCEEEHCELARELKISLSSVMPILGFADPQNVDLISDLKEVSQ